MKSIALLAFLLAAPLAAPPLTITTETNLGCA